MPYISATEEIIYAPCDLRLPTIQFSLFVIRVHSRLICFSNLVPQLLPWIFWSQLLQLLPQFADFQVPGLGHRDFDFHDLVAAHSFTGCRGHALVPQAQFLAALGSGRHSKLGASVHAGDVDFRAQPGFHGRDRHGHVDVVGVTLENRMLPGADDDKQVAGGRALRPGIAFARQTDALSVARSRLDSDFQRFGSRHHRRPMADRTEIARLSRAVTARTGRIELHAARVLRDLAAAAAFRAGADRAHAALAIAVRAGRLAGNIETHHCAANRVPEADVDLISQVRAGLRLVIDSRPASAARSKDA